jgi:hypothetical protein
LLTVHEFLAIIWRGQKIRLKNKIKFPEITATFVHLVRQIDARQTGLSHPVHEGKNQLRAQVSRYLTAAGLFSFEWKSSLVSPHFSPLC